MKRFGGRLEHLPKLPFGLVLLVVTLLSCSAYGDVGVVLEESLNSSVDDWVASTGHTAVYFSRICPESPVKLRLCRPGEEGSVMSTYPHLGEDQPFEWNIVPLTVYVYGVEDAHKLPLFGSEKVKAMLEQQYRDQALPEYCSHENCRTSEKAQWRYMVGAAMSRSMYIFVVKSTLQQDLDLIKEFNALPNENHFNGVTRNCADFAKKIVDAYFPHAAHRDVIDDFGMTSPKAVARTFTRYAHSHPELRFYVLHFSQLPGTFRPSSEARNPAEQLYHSKKLLVPMVIFAHYELPIIAAAHVLAGRFNPEHEFEEHPAIQVVQLGFQLNATNPVTSAPRERLRDMETQEREEVVGAPEKWKRYKQEFTVIVKKAFREDSIRSRSYYITHLFEYLNKSGKPFIDGHGALWMEVPEGDRTCKVGVSTSNIFAQGSDRRLAFALLLARVDQVLKSPKHRRETMVEFKEDWALLEHARWRYSEPVENAAMQHPYAGR